MANLVKITEVYVYCGLTSVEGAADAVKVKKILVTNGIPYTLIAYHHDDQHLNNVKTLSTWVFGPDFKQFSFSDMPVIIWKEFYDDYERYLECVHSSDELLTSNLLKFKEKVVVSK